MAGRKSLGQAKPAAGALTTLYTVPALKEAACSSIAICNQSQTKDWFRLSHAVAGAADTPAQYVYWDVEVPAGCTFVATIGITAAATDVVRIQSTFGNCSFNLWGMETTA